MYGTISIIIEKEYLSGECGQASANVIEILAGEWNIIYNECVRNVCTSLLAVKDDEL